jgi:hypothetical protein
MSDLKNPFDLGNPPSIQPVYPNLEALNKDTHFLASGYYERLADYIINFEKELKENEEVGAKLITFGESIIIHIDDIGYWNPRLITFDGYDTTGQKVKLIQHVNQISVLLIKLERTHPERPRIGFKLSKDLEEKIPLQSNSINDR